MLQGFYLIAVLLAASAMQSAFAQDKVEVSDTSKDFQDFLESQMDRTNSQDQSGVDDDQTALFPELIPAGLLDENGRQVQMEALTSYYRYRVKGFEHRQRVFEWQYYSGIVIFIMVIGIVSIGLYFSWMQFHANENPNSMPESTIEASTTGLKVSSPVLGVIILVLSLAFFYLYLVHVYPILDTF